jgi:hypothetical protein
MVETSKVQKVQIDDFAMAGNILHGLKQQQPIASKQSNSDFESWIDSLMDKYILFSEPRDAIEEWVDDYLEQQA